MNARTSPEDIEQFYPKENILSIEGSKYTIIIFEGNIIHSGGYVKIGERISLYMEITNNI